MSDVCYLLPTKLVAGWVLIACLSGRSMMSTIHSRQRLPLVIYELIVVSNSLKPNQRVVQKFCTA